MAKRRRRRGKRNAKGQFVKKTHHRRRRARAASPVAAAPRRRRRRRARAAAAPAAAPRRRRRRRARAAAPTAAPRRRRRSHRRRSHRRRRARAAEPRKIRVYRKRPVVRRRNRRIGGRRRRVYTVKARTKRDRARGLLRNPLTGGELVTIGFTGLLGFGSADMLDRFLATHALDTTSTAALATTGKIMDPTAASGTAYAGMFNGAAIAAPMNVTRWAAGLGGMTALPIIIGGFVRAPLWRAVFQGFGIGAGLRTIGKGLNDLIAHLFKPTASNPHATFQRLYVNEMAAAAFKSGSMVDRAMVVSTGLGAAPNGHRCAECDKSKLGAPPAPHQQPLRAPMAAQPPAPLPAGNPGAPVRSRLAHAAQPVKTGWRSAQRSDG